MRMMQIYVEELMNVFVDPFFLQDEVDPAFAILSDYVTRDDPAIRMGAILGLGLAYAGREKEELQVSAGFVMHC